MKSKPNDGYHVIPEEDQVKASSKKWRETSEVCPCLRCKGRGYIFESHMVCYHNDEWNTTRRLCKNCQGHGRITVTVRSIHYEEITEAPYTLNYSELDNGI